MSIAHFRLLQQRKELHETDSRAFCAISLVQETLHVFFTRKLMSVRQGTQEPVSTFCSRFRRTLLQINGTQDGILPEMTMVTSYHEGLRPEFNMSWNETNRLP